MVQGTFTAPVWFFDKEPQLQQIWDITDRHYIRNVNEETAILLEDLWRQGKRGENSLIPGRKNFYPHLKSMRYLQYELQRDGESLELLTWDEFADEFRSLLRSCLIS